MKVNAVSDAFPSRGDGQGQVRRGFIPRYSCIDLGVKWCDGCDFERSEWRVRKISLMLDYEIGMSTLKENNFSDARECLIYVARWVVLFNLYIRGRPQSRKKRG